MISKNEIKRVRFLLTKKGREESGLFTVEGIKSVKEALASSFEVKCVYCASDDVATEICAANVPCETVGDSVMEAISFSVTTTAMAVVKQPVYDTSEIIDKAASSDSLSLALDSVRDPGNLGTILRIADWFGIDAVFASPDTVELFNPKTVQASMGSIFRTKLIYSDIVSVAQSFAKAGKGVFGTFLDGEDIYKKELPSQGLIVMGSESFGISKAVENCVSNRLLIPSFNRSSHRAESLNVAVATAIVCSEFCRKL
ncbi:MAG: RNA methyltransferase [Bacteroidales bacterium]|nr:RNA methyltransferase [Bacteroidales bacterium]